MTKKKKQHYVSHFYLSNFSNDSKKKSIGLWNKRTKLFVENASLKNQAYSNYFYGKDEVIENALSKYEDAVSLVIRNIIINNRLPEITDVNWLNLLTFIVYQADRTKGSIDMLDDTFNKMIRTAFKDDNRIKDILPDVKIGNEDSPAFQIGVTTNIMPVTYDLGMLLIVNNTKQDFITSDNPVIKYNQFLELRKWPSSHIGWSVIGLQVFFPISPRLYIMLFDKDIYKIRYNTYPSILVKKISDVTKLNALQYLNSTQNIYFSGDFQNTYFENLHQNYFDKYDIERTSVKEYIEVKSDKNSEFTGSLIASTRNSYKIGLSLSFLKFTKRSKNVKLGPSLAIPRNPRLVSYVESICEEYLKKKKENLENKRKQK